MKEINQTLTVLCSMRNMYNDAPIKDKELIAKLDNEIDKFYQIENLTK